MPPSLGSLKDKEYGELTVIEDTPRISVVNNRNIKHWHYKCSCGRRKWVLQSNLTTGLSTSCGVCVHCGDKNAIWTGCGDIPGHWWACLKQNAKRKDIPVEITIEDCWKLFVSQNRKCIYTGVELQFPKKQNKTVTRGTASLDRINSDLPYCQSNIQFVHKWVNVMKNDHTEAEFLEIVKNIAEHRQLCH